MIAEAATLSNGTGVELGLGITVVLMIIGVVRLLSKAEHNQAAHTKAIEELKACQDKQQSIVDSHTLKLDRLERTDCHAARTGRFSAIEERDR